MVGEMIRCLLIAELAEMMFCERQKSWKNFFPIKTWTQKQKVKFTKKVSSTEEQVYFHVSNNDKTEGNMLSSKSKIDDIQATAADMAAAVAQKLLFRLQRPLPQSPQSRSNLITLVAASA